MLIFDKQHRNWLIFVLLAFAAAGASYFFYRESTLTNGGSGPSGSTIPGLAYGIVGFSLMIFCGLLGARRAVRVWKLGRARTWLRAHIWLGLLAYPLIVFHSGGIFFGHKLTFWLMVIFVAVEVTGIFGVILQQFIPKMMLSSVKAESTFEQIPEVIRKLKYDAAIITSTCCGQFDTALLDSIEPNKTERKKIDESYKKKYASVAPKESDSDAAAQGAAAQPLMDFFKKTVEPFLDPHYESDSQLAEVQKSKAVFKHIETLLPERLHDALNEIQGLCDERRQLQTQVTLHRVLHFWEYAHIPLSYLLLALSLFHAVIATWGYSGVLNKH